MSRAVWIVGATGLTGHQTLLSLLENQSFSHVLAVVRRATGVTNPRLEELVVDFEALARELLGRKTDIAICCLGTTIKQAGSQANFRHIDFDYTLAFAQCALAGGAKHFIVVTALGADPKSRVFYNRVKGELEAALGSFGFDALTIVRPSLLLGEREKARLGERLARPFMRLLPSSMRGVDTRKLGRVLAQLALEPAAGKRIVLSKEIQELSV